MTEPPPDCPVCCAAAEGKDVYVKTVPCSHLFCSTCVEELFERNVFPAGPPYFVIDKGFFTCPVCRACVDDWTVDIPENKGNRNIALFLVKSAHNIGRIQGAIAMIEVFEPFFELMHRRRKFGGGGGFTRPGMDAVGLFLGRALAGASVLLIIYGLHIIASMVTVCW